MLNTFVFAALLELHESVREISRKNEGVEFLQVKGILHETKFYRNGHAMSLPLTSKEDDRWRCYKSRCYQNIAMRNKNEDLSLFSHVTTDSSVSLWTKTIRFELIFTKYF